MKEAPFKIVFRKKPNRKKIFFKKIKNTCRNIWKNFWYKYTCNSIFGEPNGYYIFNKQKLN